MKAVVKICALWKYAKAHNIGDALWSTLIRDTTTEINKASRLIMGKRIVKAYLVDCNRHCNVIDIPMT